MFRQHDAIVTKVILFVVLVFSTACTPLKKHSTATLEQTASPAIGITEAPTQPVTSKTKTGSMATAQALVSQATFSTQQPPEPFPDNWVPWLKENSYPLQSITNEDFSDLSFLVPLLENKRIIQLGENRHNTAEYSAVKVRMIKFLHEQLGYNVIAFESGLFESYVTNKNISEISPKEAMQNSIYGIWHTSEVLDLFSYLEETQSSEQPLILAGFDIQTSGDARAQSSQLLYDVIATIDPDYAKDVFDFDRFLWENYGYLSRDFEIDQLTFYTSLTDFFDEHQNEFLTLFKENSSTFLVARQTAWSTAKFIEQSLSHDSSNIRDQAMATNVDFLLSDLYPDEKIIIWAHNAHISKHSDQEVYFPMGTFISDKYETDVYTIGLFSYGEQSADNKTFMAGSMEALFHEVGQPNLFVDLDQHQQITGNEWIFDGLRIYSFNFHDFKPIARNYFDGILFIDSVSFPEYIE